MAGRFGKKWYVLGRKGLLGNSEVSVSEGIWCLEYSWYVLFVKPLCPPPPQPPAPPPEGLNFAPWPHPNWLVMSGHTSAENFQVSQVAGCWCNLLAGNSSISLAGSVEQINFSQQSPKMLKMASESFIHALLLFLGLFLKISRWLPLQTTPSLRAGE